jgi:hypothetical protein
MYVLRNLVARGRKVRIVRAVRGAIQAERAHRLIADEIGTLARAFDRHCARGMNARRRRALQVAAGAAARRSASSYTSTG